MEHLPLASIWHFIYILIKPQNQVSLLNHKSYNKGLNQYQTNNKHSKE